MDSSVKQGHLRYSVLANLGRIVPIDQGASYSLEHDIFFHRKSNGKIQRPLSICINMGRFCNLACRVCLSNSTPKEEYLPAEVLREILNTLCVFIPVRLVWSGGEPLLHPDIRVLLNEAIRAGFLNVVTSNATARDSLKSLAGSFTYNVSIYGIDEMSYRRSTGRDAFRSFRQSFQKLFSSGHNVTANVRITGNWQRYLPQYIDWLKHYPIRKLSLMNTIARGRLAGDQRPADPSEINRLTEYLKTRQLPFPVVCPPADSGHCVNDGYIVVEGVKRGASFAQVNASTCSTPADLQQRIYKLSANNRRLFLLENYVSVETICAPSISPEQPRVIHLCARDG